MSALHHVKALQGVVRSGPVGPPIQTHALTGRSHAYG